MVDPTRQPGRPPLVTASTPAPPPAAIEPASTLRLAARHALGLSRPEDKTTAVARLVRRLEAGELPIGGQTPLPGVEQPGRPDRPELVHPHRVPRRKLSRPEGRAALLHALAHIEFNAINLALDALARFHGLPDAYYRDWARVAGEEATHFGLLSRHLNAMGWSYGDFPAHDGLWEMATRTAGDPLARMGLVPRILEARGLDVTPGIREKLARAGDHQAAGILDIILRDEVEHVAIGNRWFGWLCQQRGRGREESFAELLQRYGVSAPHPPFNEAARLAAGFSRGELAGWGG